MDRHPQQRDPSIFLGDYLSFSDIVFRNNIVSDAATGYGTYIPSDAFAQIDPDYNLYDQVRGGYPYADDLDQWQAGGKDVNSLFATPRFVGPDDFRLADDSPARGAGADVLGLFGGGTVDLGAFVTGDTAPIGPG